ncbi:GlyGly-anchored extracellular serine protease VesB [Vibrio cholerae]|nr:GlyGly-anchored extracellular serine protease VesB [Vibrio cholerae]ELJ8444980.1 GlyGly-anchored extracellular serine protease VesB [Vibrio cholerae]ELJ8725472.1 GlyGly-anchored extracellular serine protease VesB [Vibrio cholerae]
MHQVSKLLSCFIGFSLFSTLLYAESTADISSRIINGSNANSAEWPSIVALVKRGADAYQGQFCGGSFLGGRYVLTAAHCFDSRSAASVDVIIGAYDLNNSSQGERIAAQKIYRHLSYSPSNLLNDIAIVELAQTSSLPAITLAGPATRTSLPALTPLTVAGWGITVQSKPPQFTPILQEVDVDLVSQSLCQIVMQHGISSDPNSTNFCAARLTKDSCQGDSGGPIVVKTGREQLGIVSWGDEQCAKTGTYGVYTNVSYFRDWITKHTNQLSYDQVANLGIRPLGKVSQSFTYTNLDANALTYTGNTFSSLPADFSVLSDGCSTKVTLATGESCSVEVAVDAQHYRQYQYDFELIFSYAGGSKRATSRIQLDTSPFAPSASSGSSIGWFGLLLLAPLWMRRKTA